MTKTQWLSACAKRFLENSDLTAEDAMSLAESCLGAEAAFFGGEEQALAGADPSESANEEMACW